MNIELKVHKKVNSLATNESNCDINIFKLIKSFSFQFQIERIRKQFKTILSRLKVFVICTINLFQGFISSQEFKMLPFNHF